MSIDYRDQVCNRPLDADGFELPPWLNPFLSDYNPELAEQADIQWLNENPTLPPITGGSPEPFEPSDEDWADYHEFCREVDRRYEMERMDRLEDEYRMRYGN
jgi:hypothetical protein